MRAEWGFAIVLGVIVRAVRLGAAFAVLALFYFQKVGVVFLLLPAMRILTLVLIRTALRV